jgi:hypothetical protein
MATQPTNTTPPSRAPDQPRKTVNGERLRVTELNTDVPFVDRQAVDPEATDQHPAGGSKLLRWWRNLNLVLAGMYTGLTCYGTPHSKHPGHSDKESTTQADKPDNRPI